MWHVICVAAQERNREEALLYKGNTSVPPYYRANAVITDEDWDDGTCSRIEHFELEAMKNSKYLVNSNL